jgi:hypothetical protein
MTPSLRGPRRRSAVSDAGPPREARTFCRACGAIGYRCALPDGTTVVLDPLPRDGGPFLVNPYTATVVAVRTPSQCRGEGFVAHHLVCGALAVPAPRSA